jgi:hypothetical protein
VEPVFDQERQATAVVDVGVAQHNAVYPARIERETGIECIRLCSPALEQSRVEQNPRSGGLEQVHRAGNLAGGTPERESGSAQDDPRRGER